MGTPRRPDFRDFNRAVLSLEEQAGRELVIVGCAYLDLLLTIAIEAHFDPSYDPDAQSQRIFTDRGPAGTFSAKIELAHALGITSPTAYRELHVVRKIRNEAAHAFDVFDLTSGPLRDRVMSLQFWRSPNVPGPALATAVAPGPRTFVEFEHLGRSWSVDTAHVLGDANDNLVFVVPAVVADDQDSVEVLRAEIWGLIYILIGAVRPWWGYDVRHPPED